VGGNFLISIQTTPGKKFQNFGRQEPKTIRIFLQPLKNPVKVVALWGFCGKTSSYLEGGNFRGF